MEWRKPGYSIKHIIAVKIDADSFTASIVHKVD